MNSQHGMDKAIARLRERAPSEELDYPFVMDCLEGYEAPRVKLAHLLKIGALIRIKKGLYVFGPPFRRGPYCVELIANKIYGPSYVSLEWALQYYGLIPERVEVVTSVTWKRKREFQTPIRRFTFHHINRAAFPTGITQIEFSEYQRALVATPEKALCDTLILRRGRCRSVHEMEQICFEDLRIEPDTLQELDFGRIERIHRAFPHSAIEYFIKLTRRLTE